MGQRLNVEIWNNGNVLANAYYHWSAYTPSAAQIVNSALNYIKNNPHQDDNDLLYAIRILEATGAGLTACEIEHAKLCPVLDGATFADCISRNAGLIGISDEGISGTRRWQEGSVYIFLDEKRISFCVFSTQSIWDWEKDRREYNENENANAKNLDVVTLNFDDIKFDNWIPFYEFLTKRTEPFRSAFEPFEVVTPIY